MMQGNVVMILLIQYSEFLTFGKPIKHGMLKIKNLDFLFFKHCLTNVIHNLDLSVREWSYVRCNISLESFFTNPLNRVFRQRRFEVFNNVLYHNNHLELTCAVYVSLQIAIWLMTP